MQMYDVFISYKTEDFRQADWVREVLEHNGIRCWMAPASIPGGSSYAAEIPAAIRECRFFVLILSEQAQLSKWVPRELDQAINEGKIILPFMLENCALRDDFNFYLSNVQRYAAYENKAAAVEKMVREIQALQQAANPLPEPSEPTEPATPQQPAAPELPPQKTPAKKRRAPKTAGTPRRRKWMILLAVLCAAAVLWVVRYFAGTVVVAGERYSKNEWSLYIKESEITERDVQAIAKMKRLSTLHLEKCSILPDDIGLLAGEQLSGLYLSDCDLKQEQYDSLHLSDRTLYQLDLSGNPQIRTLGLGQQACAELISLDISGTGIAQIAPETQFPRMTSFFAGGTGLEDLSFLRGSKDLTQLYVTGNNLRSLDGLENCIRLDTLHAADNDIELLDGLRNTTVLRDVCLSGNRIADIGVLSGSAETLQRIALQDNQLTDLSALEGCGKLEYLSVGGNRIESLAPLAQSRALTAVLAKGNAIKTTAGIEGLDTLHFLDLSDNGLEQVGVETALTFMPKDGAVLNLSGSSLTALRIDYPFRFRLLGLSGAQLPGYDVLYDNAASMLALDYSDGIDLQALKQAGHTEYFLSGCPANRQLDVEEALGELAVEFVPEGTACDMQNYLYSQWPAYLNSDNCTEYTAE